MAFLKNETQHYLWRQVPKLLQNSLQMFESKIKQITGT